MLRGRFRFCFVCLNEKSPSHALLTLEELEKSLEIEEYNIKLIYERDLICQI
jgi:hypothetical protein